MLRLKRSIVSFVMTPVIAGLILTVLSPFGTDSFSLLGRATFCIGMSLAGGLGALLAQFALKRLWPSLTGWLHSVIQSFGATLAVAPFVISGFGYGFGNTSLTTLLLTLFYIWIIAIVITAFAELAAHRASDVSDETPQQRPVLMDRLPLAIRDAELFGVTSEDHYVRIHTSAGSHMVLMRLADVDTLAHPIRGLSPHRSWWVAQQGVRTIRRAGGKIVIELKDGTDVPVSRQGARRLKEAGWLN